MTNLPNCWEIKNCGRQKGGTKVAELGECISSREGLGHSCWAIAGTLCGGEVQGTSAQKEDSCTVCPVFKDYNRITGTLRKEVQAAFPDEQEKYSKMIRDRHKNKTQK